MDTMKIDPEIIRHLREERAWSQEHLAAVTGLSLRTIQRVESEANASAETRSLPSPPNSSEATASGTREVASKLSYWQYRLLRFAVIVGLLVWLDVHVSGSVTWSRWVLIFGTVLLTLRVIKSQFVDSRSLRRRRSAERNV